MNLGNALWALGERESGTARLEQAVAAYRTALEEWTCERVPLNWAGTQKNLGTVLQTLGARENDTAKLEAAVAAFDEVISANPKDANAYNSRCWTRVIIGQQLQQGLADCNESLRIRPNDAYTLDSRGFAYLKLDRLDDAIVDFSAALEINSKLVSSLYGRGLAKLRKADCSGEADISDAKAIQANIAEEFKSYGIN
jgi:tetratricopeptide (TPR) repeat protein